jgi:predicted GNAT superfamily acetyltransferase
LNSKRVLQRQNAESQRPEISSGLIRLVRADGQGGPVRGQINSVTSQQRVGIEIPTDIESIEKKDSALAWEWRLATRWAFTECLQAGFAVTEFRRGIPGAQTGTYQLEKE